MQQADSLCACEQLIIFSCALPLLPSACATGSLRGSLRSLLAAPTAASAAVYFPHYRPR